MDVSTLYMYCTVRSHRHGYTLYRYINGTSSIFYLLTYLYSIHTIYYRLHLEYEACWFGSIFSCHLCIFVLIIDSCLTHARNPSTLTPSFLVPSFVPSSHSIHSCFIILTHVREGGESQGWKLVSKTV